jgi:uncharacterized membrane protein YfcA
MGKLNESQARLLIGCILGAILGSLLIQKIPELIARRAFALFLIYAAWRLWTK